MFGTVLVSACTGMHIYIFWRAASVPVVYRHVPREILIGAGVVLWAIFFTGRVFGHGGTGALAGILEFCGMNWMAVLFLTSVCLLATDIVTGFGFLLPRLAPSLRGWALAAGALLSGIALFQGLRPPVIQEYEVNTPGLPNSLDGTVIIALSDLHLGSQLGERWLADRIAQVAAQQPDLVVLLGDIFEGHGSPQDELIPTLNRLSAPLGVWAVNGNHETHGKRNIHQLEKDGFRLLRDRWTEVRPGLVLVGVDDLTALRRTGRSIDTLSGALTGRPRGATILLSHTPWQADRAASASVDLMLSGHTHGGQIWPFGYLVRRIYPLLEGRHEVDGMTVIVCRGTGTWGPRMRLWCPGEILRVTLRAPENLPPARLP